MCAEGPLEAEGRIMIKEERFEPTVEEKESPGPQDRRRLL